MSFDLRDVWLEEASAEELLDLEEQLELGRRIEAGDAAAAEQLTAANLRLVVLIAKEYQGQGLDLEDLICEGNVGLVKAVQRYDWRLGFRFTTYASVWIRRDIRYAISQQTRTVRLPADVVQAIHAWRRISSELGRDATAAEVAARTSHHPSLAARAIAEADRACDSLHGDEPIEAPEPPAPTAEREVEQLLEQLAPDDRETLVVAFGLGDDVPQRASDLGRLWDCSWQAASHRVRGAVSRARATARRRYVADEPPEPHESD